jgi:hypothetical protein
MVSVWAPPWAWPPCRRFFFTGVDYSTRPPGFDGGVPEDFDDIEATVERLNGHGIAIADSIHPQSVLNMLFD